MFCSRPVALHPVSSPMRCCKRRGSNGTHDTGSDERPGFKEEHYSCRTEYPVKGFQLDKKSLVPRAFSRGQASQTDIILSFVGVSRARRPTSVTDFPNHAYSF